MTYNHEYFEWETVYMIFFFFWDVMVGFPGSSADKKPACNAGDPGSFLGLGSSPGEGIGYPLQYYWASLMAQMVTNLPAVLETWVWFQGWEDSLEEHMATQYFSLENLHEQRSLVGYSPWGHKESDMTN